MEKILEQINKIEKNISNLDPDNPLTAVMCMRYRELTKKANDATQR